MSNPQTTSASTPPATTATGSPPAPADLGSKAGIGLDPEVWCRLAAPFDPKQVKFKPGAVSGNRALAMHFIDARLVMERLDAVCHPSNWRDEYTVLPSNDVVCSLSIRIAGEWVTKVDVGGPSEQPDESDRMKAAFSDALKRAAVKWGIGRYLYSLPQQWVDYDPQKRRFLRDPVLPGNAGQAQPAKKPAQPDGGAAPSAAAAPPAHPAGRGRVSPEQAASLMGMLALPDGGTAEAWFCKVFAVGAVAELPAAKFDEAVSKIDKAKAKAEADRASAGKAGK